MSTVTKAGAMRKTRRRIVLVAACSQRKRLVAPAELSLSSIKAPSDERVREWRRRLARVSAPRASAFDIYAGDHWHAVLDAYRLACGYSSRAELWVLSAGYGLIRADKRIKAYSATFAIHNPDSVWRGPGDGARAEQLQGWWQTLNHQASLEELLPGRGGGALVIVAGAAYLTAIHTDLARTVSELACEEALSVISAGTHGNGALLPVSGALRSAVGGTDSALNARILRLLAETADQHQFQRAQMKRVIERLRRSATPTIRRQGCSTSDASVAKVVRALRREQKNISRTRALRELRASGIACEQDRFAAIWAAVERKGT